MSDESREFFKCSECGDIFSSEGLLKEHFRLEHSDVNYQGPVVEEKSLKDYWKKVRPHLNLDFGLGLVLGVLLTSMVFGGAAAWQSFTGPSPVEITVVSCENCSYDAMRNATDNMFDAKYSEVDYKSEEGQNLVEKHDLTYVPGFVFDSSIRDRANFTRIAHQLVKSDDSYVLVDGEGEAARLYSEGHALE